MRGRTSSPHRRGRIRAVACSAGLALGVLAATAPPALAGESTQKIRFRLLAGTYSSRLDASGPKQLDICSLGGIATSATVTTKASIGRQPDDQGGFVEFDEAGTGSGQIGAVGGSGSATASWNGCNDVPPKSCRSTASGETLGQWAIIVEIAKGEPDAKLTWLVPPAAIRMGDITCLFPSVVAARTFSFTTREPLETLLSGEPVTLSVSGSDSAPGGFGASIGGTYSVSLTVQALGVLSIRTAPATNTSETGGRWPFSFDAAWKDDICANPPPGSPSPLAYAVIGTDKERLSALLGAPQNGLASNPAFKRNAFRLGSRANGKHITGNSRSEARASFTAAADALHARNKRKMDAGNGLFYGARIACRKSAGGSYKVEKAAPRVLCRNRRSLSGAAWGSLTATMRAKLEALYAVLDTAQVCYALSSGYRSTKKQDDLYDDWHRRADRSNPADRNNRTLNQLCPGGQIGNGPMRGFLQCPTGWDRNGVARNGPARPGSSRHEKGEAADLKLAFGALTGRFDPSDAERKADVRTRFAAYVQRVPGLCPSPSRDPGHIELPYSVTRRDAQGNEVEEPPRCHFSDGVEASSAARAARSTASPARASARRRARRVAIPSSRALDLTARLGRRFVTRSLIDSYLDWSAGSCRASRRSTTCRLVVTGENGRRPFACRTLVLVRKSGRRTTAAVLGRRTRCR